MEGEHRALKPMHIYKHMVKLEHVLKQELNISMSEISVLTALADQGQQKMGDLVRWVELPMSTVTGLVDKLVAKKLVVREKKADDKRVLMLRLTQEGAETLSGCSRLLSQELLPQLTPLPSPIPVQEEEEEIAAAEDVQRRDSWSDERVTKSVVNLEWD